MSHDLVEQAGHHAFADGHEVFLAHEGHLHVDLGELGLPVGPEVFVPEAFDDLVVPVESGHHQELLEQLRGLGQGVEAAVVDPGGDQVVPSALRGGLGQDRGLHVEEPLLVE